MPAVKDFRNYSFSQQRIERCAKYLGRQFYWKLFRIENTLRIMINSILTVQYHERGGQWWDDLAGKAKITAERNKRKYSKPDAKFFSIPGRHPIYFTDIKDLSEIIRINIPLFIPVIGFEMLNKLIVEIENIFIPRNIIAHMNFPTKIDLNRIDILSHDLSIYINFVLERDIELKIP